MSVEARTAQTQPQTSKQGRRARSCSPWGTRLRSVSFKAQPKAEGAQERNVRTGPHTCCEDWGGVTETDAQAAVCVCSALPGAARGRNEEAGLAGGLGCDSCRFSPLQGGWRISPPRPFYSLPLPGFGPWNLCSVYCSHFPLSYYFIFAILLLSEWSFS